jgi:hypothetical protein
MFEFRAQPKTVTSNGAFKLRGAKEQAPVNPLMMEKIYIKDQEEKIKNEFLKK